MFQLKNGSNRDCDGVTRHDVLIESDRSTACSSWLLPEVFRARAVGRVAEARKSRASSALAPVGISAYRQLRDPKPEAPAEIRVSSGSSRPRSPGFRFASLCPRLAPAPG